MAWRLDVFQAMRLANNPTGAQFHCSGWQDSRFVVTKMHPSTKRQIEKLASRIPAKAGILGIGHFLRSAAARRPLLHLESPVRASDGSPGQARAGARDRRPPSRRPGSAFQPVVLLSPRIALPLSDSGGEVGRGGLMVTERRVSRFVVLQRFLGTKRDFRKSAGSPPHPNPPPTPKTC